MAFWFRPDAASQAKKAAAAQAGSGDLKTVADAYRARAERVQTIVAQIKKAQDAKSTT